MYIVAWKKKSKDTKEHYEVETIDEFLKDISDIMKNEFLIKEPDFPPSELTARESDLLIMSDVKFIGISKKDEDYLFLDYRYYKEVDEKEFYESML